MPQVYAIGPKEIKNRTALKANLAVQYVNKLLLDEDKMQAKGYIFKDKDGEIVFYRIKFDFTEMLPYTSLHEIKKAFLNAGWAKVVIIETNLVGKTIQQEIVLSFFNEDILLLYPRVGIILNGEIKIV